MSCVQCGKPVGRRNKLHCSKACANRTIAQNRAVLYKNGGRKISSGGYAMILTRTGYELEHRLFMEHYLGRPLEDWEDVHHKNGNKLDNSRENLVVLSRSEHMSYHAKNKIRQRDEQGRYV